MERLARHWDRVFTDADPVAVSWYERSPETSLRLVTSVATPSAAVVDVGGGASYLVDALRAAGFRDLTLLDVSTVALEQVRARLGDAVTYVTADVLGWDPPRAFGVWHDRAVFHFLTDPDDQRRYADVAASAVRPGGSLVLGTFAADGPTSCSGLPTARYDSDALAGRFVQWFDLTATEREEHVTPSGVVQPFTWVVLRRN